MQFIIMNMILNTIIPCLWITKTVSVVNTHGSWVFCGPNIRCECTNCLCCFKILSEMISTGKTTWTGGIGQSYSILMAYSHCTEKGQGAVQRMGLAQEETMGPGPCPCLRPV